MNYTEPDALDRIRDFAPTVDRITEVALHANLQMDLALSRPDTVIVTYAADGPYPVLPVRACMTANVLLRFVLLYNVPEPALRQATEDITRALEEGALTELPVHRFLPEEIAAAHEAVETGETGKVIIDPKVTA